jgi:hypothetical protein
MTGVYYPGLWLYIKSFQKRNCRRVGVVWRVTSFHPVLAKLQGAKLTQVDVKHHPAYMEKSKYGIQPHI